MNDEEIEIAKDINSAIGYYHDLGLMCPECYKNYPEEDNELELGGPDGGILICPRCKTKIIITVRIEKPNG